MAKKKTKDDESKAIARYVDQPGQWRSTTPASTKKKQKAAFEQFENMMKKKKKK